MSHDATTNNTLCRVFLLLHNNNMPLFSFFLSSNTAPPRPKFPRRWPGLVTTLTKYRPNTQRWTLKIQEKKNNKISVCVYVCTSEPVPNESFTGSSTSGHSSTHDGTGSMCLCVCAHVCVNVWQKCRPIEFVFILLFVLSKKCEWLFATATHREPISVNLLIYYSFLKKNPNTPLKFLHDGG